jgi:ubiquinone/menaquinone biosynthesis C-methylase UbiE
MRRTLAAELLDADLGTPEEVASSLCDLRRINRWFGGIRTTQCMLERVVRQQACSQTKRRGKAKLTISLLDVGAGSGDIAHALTRQLRPRGIELRPLLLDRMPSHLRSCDMVCVPRLAADARALPLRDDSVDVVSCALLAHHLQPDEIVSFVNEALRVARIAVLMNDLRRSWMHLAAVYAGFAFYGSRLTRHDAPASVRRAYTREELGAIVRRTRAAQVEARNYCFFRIGVIAWKNGRGM